MRQALFVLAVLGFLVARGGAAAESRPVIFTRLEAALPEKPGVALLVFISTECATCYGDLFEMRYLVEKNGWPVSVVGIAAGIREDLEVFLEKYAWPFPVVWDRKKTAFKKFGVRNPPSKILLVAGEVVYRDDPYEDHERRRAAISKFLGGVFSRLG